MSLLHFRPSQQLVPGSPARPMQAMQAHTRHANATTRACRPPTDWPRPRLQVTQQQSPRMHAAAGVDAWRRMHWPGAQPLIAPALYRCTMQQRVRCRVASRNGDADAAAAAAAAAAPLLTVCLSDDVRCMSREARVCPHVCWRACAMPTTCSTTCEVLANLTAHIPACRLT